ncbi:alginate lyase family protein [Paenibacillus pseudetheri]|uniref:alginate lyase family protein n=1 Tax=Paenibacillus pseudetheri TaxID=2897682 RepID=UPI001F480362|nr:alginate lyase family protein [Paenibacillus pseudetheri]
MKADLWSLLNLEAEGLEAVQAALARGDEEEAYAALRSHYATRTSPRLYYDAEDTDVLADYVRRHCSEAMELALRTADEVVGQTFVFQFPWDMERTNIPVTFDGLIRWDEVPDHDVEWAYMLNRHRYWIALGQAYVLTGEERFAETLCRQMEDWIDRNPVPARPTRENVAWRSIEAGLRCGNWIKAFKYIKDSSHLTPKRLAKMLISLHEHGEYIVADFNDWKRTSNWGVLENHGLFGLSVFAPEFKQAMKWRALSVVRLNETTRLQVTKEGMHWEQSPMYHNEVLHCYADTMSLCRKNSLKVEPAIEDAVRQMMYADLYMAKPNGHQPMQGDSDDNDLRDMLTAGAVLLRDGVLKFGAYDHLDFDSVWNYGSEGIEAFAALEVQPPPHLSFPFRQSGNYAMRSDWERDALYAYFHCGFLGGGHGHADMLHFDLHAYGKDLLMDAGRYNYSDAKPLRRSLKQCSAHNTTLVDGIDFTEILDTWGFGRVAHPTDVTWISKPGFDYVEGGHTGYRHLPDRVDPLRRIIFVKNAGYWILIDSFDCKEEHTFTQYFHFALDDIAVNHLDGSCQTLDRAGANLCIIPAHPERLATTVNDGWISYEYNRVLPNRSLTYTCRAKGFTSMISLLFPQPPGNDARPTVEPIDVCDHSGKQVSAAAAEAVRIRFPDPGIEHLVVIRHETGAPSHPVLQADGVRFLGNVALIERSSTDECITVIK